MDYWLRFSDLRTRKIINNRVTLRNRIRKDGFPPGRLIGPNSRAWTEHEVRAWLDSRPTAPKPSTPNSRRGRPRKAITSAAELAVD